LFGLFDNPWIARGIFAALVGRQLSLAIPSASSIQDRGRIEAHLVLFTDCWGSNVHEAKREIPAILLRVPDPAVHDCEPREYRISGSALSKTPYIFWNNQIEGTPESNVYCVANGSSW
jgi:hypothetical protein